MTLGKKRVPRRQAENLVAVINVISGYNAGAFWRTRFFLKEILYEVFGGMVLASFGEYCFHL